MNPSPPPTPYARPGPQVRRSAFWAVLLGLLSAFLSCPAHAQRVVFAHFMLANQDYVAADAPRELVIASYQREIREAQAIGIDGFALNAGGWFQEPRYIVRAEAMFEAAYRLKSHFKLLFSADMCCSNNAEDVEDMVRRFANNNRYRSVYYTQRGRFLLTTFAGTRQGADFWRQVRTDLETGTNLSVRSGPTSLTVAGGVSASRPIPISLVPAFFWGGELPGVNAIESGLKGYADIMDGAFYWGIAGVPGLGRDSDQLPSSRAYASVLHHAGKLYMAPICFQFWGANAGRYYEYSGYEGMRAMWMDAINISHPEMIEIITWNDFIEGTYVSRMDDPVAHPGANDLDANPVPLSKGYFHSHAGAADLLTFYIRWYKTGSRPVIRRDSVYWAYRTVQALHSDSLPRSTLFGPVKDVLYVTANLTSAAVLRVVSGARTQTIWLPAGSTDVQVPMVAGETPLFKLFRNQQQVMSESGRDAIVADAPFRNLYYSTGSMHN